MRQLARNLFAVFTLLAGAGFTGHTHLQDPIVRAVLFYSPTCQHCHTVIQQHLPGIFNRYGGPATVFFDAGRPAGQIAFYEVSNGRLEIMLVDVSVPAGGSLYRSWLEAHDIPQEQWGVPRLVIADTSLVGSVDIPGLLPRFIEEGLAAGGIDWPDIAGFDGALAAIPPHERPAPAGEASIGDPVAAADTSAESAAPSPATEVNAAEEVAVDSIAPSTPRANESALDVIPSRSLTVAEKFRQDPVGNSLSVVILIAMLASVAVVIVVLRSSPSGGHLGYAIPVVAVIGLAVAGYLSYVETSGAAVVCGPVGDCNTVNQSEYAWLFGVIPVGVLGIIGYVGILAAWSVSRFGPPALSDWATIGVLAIAFAGTLFSIYLTFLEPFVIGATCAWCLTSAVAITLLMWLSARPAKRAWARLNRAPG
jgi:uncharacterized membrane protein